MARAAATLGAGVLCAAGCGATVELGPGAAVYAPSIVTIVEMPPAIDWTGPGAQQRVQRLAADSLIEVTGGRAVIADELPGTTDSDVQAALRALGEDAANTLTFSITVGLGKRLITGANPIQSFTAPKRMVVDYVARVEVRHVGAPDVIGTVEAIKTGGDQRAGPATRARGGRRPTRLTRRWTRRCARSRPASTRPRRPDADRRGARRPTPAT